MKTTILIITLSISAFTKAQTYKALDTIYANDTKNVALFFPEPIRQGITGLLKRIFIFQEIDIYIFNFAVVI